MRQPTRDRIELTHLVKVFFWTASRSSDGSTKRREDMSTAWEDETSHRQSSNQLERLEINRPAQGHFGWMEEISLKPRCRAKLPGHGY